MARKGRPRETPKTARNFTAIDCWRKPERFSYHMVSNCCWQLGWATNCKNKTKTKTKRKQENGIGSSWTIYNLWLKTSIECHLDRYWSQRGWSGTCRDFWCGEGKGWEKWGEGTRELGMSLCYGQSSHRTGCLLSQHAEGRDSAGTGDDHQLLDIWLTLPRHPVWEAAGRNGCSMNKALEFHMGLDFCFSIY